MIRIVGYTTLCFFLFCCKSQQKQYSKFVFNRTLLNLNIIDYVEGDKVFLKKGSFYIKDFLSFPNNSIVIGNQTILHFTNQDQGGVIIFENNSNITLNNITIVGETLKKGMSSEFLTSINYKNVISIRSSKKINLKGIKISNSYGPGIKVHDAEDLLIEDCKFENLGVPTPKGIPYSCDAIFLGSNVLSKNITVRNCSFRNIGSQFPTLNAPWPNDGDGIQVQAAGHIGNILIEGNLFENCTARGVKLQSGNDIIVRNNTMKDCYSAVNIPMASSMKNVLIDNNKVYNSTIAFGSDGGTAVLIEELKIVNNYVDKSEHFFRTNGYSTAVKMEIKNNKVDDLATFFVSGRYINSVISDNYVSKYATKKDKSYNMAILLNEECSNVLIDNNSFGSTQVSDVLLDNRSKSPASIKLERTYKK